MIETEIPDLGVSRVFGGDFDVAQKMIIGKYKDEEKSIGPGYDHKHPICPVCDNYLRLFAEVEKRDENYTLKRALLLCNHGDCPYAYDINKELEIEPNTLEIWM